MRNDIVDFVKYFERNGSIAPGCNSSFVTLIPKVTDPLTLRDYHSISLIASLNKIIMELLAAKQKNGYEGCGKSGAICLYQRKEIFWMTR